MQVTGYSLQDVDTKANVSGATHLPTTMFVTIGETSGVAVKVEAVGDQVFIDDVLRFEVVERTYDVPDPELEMPKRLPNVRVERG